MLQCGWTSKILYQAREASHRRINLYDSIQRKCLKQLKITQRVERQLQGLEENRWKSCLISEELQVHNMKMFSYLSHNTVNIYNNIEQYT